jgi:hypothetical protein
MGSLIGAWMLRFSVFLPQQLQQCQLSLEGKAARSLQENYVIASTSSHFWTWPLGAGAGGHITLLAKVTSQV